jgi:hypothetical protein
MPGGGTPPLTEVAGSITVLHSGPHGALAAKAVALQLTAGYSIDTPMETRPR